MIQAILVNLNNLHCAKKPVRYHHAVLFPGHNHLLTIGADDLTLWLSPEMQLSDMVCANDEE